MDSSIGSALMRILVALQHRPSSEECSSSIQAQWKEDVALMSRAVDVALFDEELGGDEVLYGRAGLLWALLNLRAHLATDFNEISKSKQADLMSILRLSHQSTRSQIESQGGESCDEVIAEIVDVLINAGIAGAAIYKKSTGDTAALPLMWPWHGKFYIGA